MSKEIYVVATTSVNKEKKITEFSISQEGYSTIEKAQKFCESRKDVYQIDDFHFEQFEEDENGWLYGYTILPITII